MKKMGLRKIRNLSQIVQFFSDYSPISYQFRTSFLHFLKCIFGNLTIPHFPPFCPQFSIIPIFPSPCG